MDLYERYIQFLTFLRKEGRVSSSIEYISTVRSRFKIPQFFSIVENGSIIEFFFKQKRRKLLNALIVGLYGFIQFLTFLRKEGRVSSSTEYISTVRSRFKIPQFFSIVENGSIIESFFKQKRRKFLNTSLGWIIWIYTDDIYNF